MAKDLTVLSVENAKPGPTRREVPDGAMRGLYLVVQPSGAKGWAVRYRSKVLHTKNGSRRNMKSTLGPYPALSLKDAREAAREMLGAVARGQEPRAAEADLIDTVIEQYVERHLKNCKTYREGERLLKSRDVMRWSGRRIDSITRRDVHEMLDGILDRGAPIMANRMLGAVRRLYNWAIKRGIVDTNPCERIGQVAPEVTRDRVLSDDELRAVWLATDPVSSTGYYDPYGAIVRMLMLTGQRRSEVSRATWAEIDLETRTLRLPKERVKNGSAHEVPLSEPVVQLLEQAKRTPQGVYVFTVEPGGEPFRGFEKSKRRLDKIAGVEGWTLHDLRRTCASGMARLGVRLEVIEKVLNHQSGSFAGIVGIYQRHTFADEKRAGLATWAAHVRALARIMHGQRREGWRV